MRLPFTLFFFIICITGYAFTNRANVNGFKSFVAPASQQAAHQDTLHINRLNKLAAGYFDKNPDSTIYYAEKSILISRKINYKTGLAEGLLQAGHVRFFKGDFNGAKKNFNEAINILKEINDNTRLGEGYTLYGKMYYLTADYILALNYLNQALILDKKIKNELAVADCYKNIGNVYYSEGKLSTALSFYYDALTLELKHQNKTAIPDDYNDIGGVLQDMEMYPSAVKFYQKALDIYRLNNDQGGIETALENIGEISYAENNYSKAAVYLNEALAIAKKQDDKEGMCIVYGDLGLCFEKENKHAEALNFLTKSLQTAVEFKIGNSEASSCTNLAAFYNLQHQYTLALKYALQGQKLALNLGNLKARRNAAQQLSITYAGLGQFADAYKMLQLFHDLKDSLYNNESIQKLTTYNLGIDFANKQKQLKLQQHVQEEVYKQRIQQQWFIISIFALLILAAISVSIVYSKQKSRQEKINLLLEQRNREVLDQKTSLDEQAQKLNNLNGLKDRLIAILAHDLRSPLSTLRGLFDLLQDETISHEQMLEMIPGVLKKLEYTSDFLNTLLFWINSQMENFDQSVKNFYIKDIVVFEADAYQEQAVKKGIKLVDSVPGNLIASADPNSIRIVVRNLVTNAIKFCKQNDTVEITAEKYDEKNQVITVSDTGAGISEEQLAKLFKSKVNSKTGTNNETGTGMGLLFCKDLIEKSNGKIWVTSKQGEGSKFSFTLPAGVANESLDGRAG